MQKSTASGSQIVATREIVKAPLEHAPQDQRAVAGDAAAGIVPDIGDDHRLA